MMRRRRFVSGTIDRAGFALLAVLWVVAMFGLLGVALSVVTRGAIAGSRNRTGVLTASWLAEGCVGRTWATLDSAASASASDPSSHAWELLDAAGDSHAGGTGADSWGAVLRPFGAMLNVNAADTSVLRRVIAALHLPEPDALVDALADWRDADDIARPGGAERGWYLPSGRAPPRDGPLADVRELQNVRGFEHLTGLDSVFGVDGGRVVINQAPLPVLSALPGFTEEAVHRLAELRTRRIWLMTLGDLEAELSPSARQELILHASELAQLATMLPERWVLTCRGRSSISPVSVVIEVTFARSGARAAVIRRRSWVE